MSLAQESPVREIARPTGWGPFLYGFTFVVIVPMGLLFYGQLLEAQVRLPVPQTPWPGFVIAVLGFGLMAWSILDLRVHGGGLPMNAYPPQNLVSKGPYRLIRHPIYWGFGMIAAGVFRIQD